MDENSPNPVRTKIVPLLKTKQYPEALAETRKLLREQPSDEIRVMEMMILFFMGAYQEAIDTWDESFAKIEDKRQRASMVTPLIMIYEDLEDEKNIKKYSQKRIDLFNVIIRDKTSPRGEKNGAKGFIYLDYLRVGNPKKALYYAKWDLDFAKKRKVPEELMGSAYLSLRSVYKALSNPKKVREYTAKYLVSDFFALISRKERPHLPEQAKRGIAREFKNFESIEEAFLILKIMKKEFMKKRGGKKLFEMAKKELCEFYKSLPEEKTSALRSLKFN